MKLQGDKDNERKTQWLVTREDERDGVMLKRSTRKHSTFFFFLPILLGPWSVSKRTQVSACLSAKARKEWLPLPVSAQAFLHSATANELAGFAFLTHWFLEYIGYAHVSHRQGHTHVIGTHTHNT